MIFKTLRSIVVVFLLAIPAATLAQQKIMTVDIWLEKDPPNSNNTPDDNNPVMDVYFPEEGKNTGRAVLVCPGGGYGGLAIHHEGEQFGKFFAEKGITAAVLKYRMPHGVHEVPLSDAKQGMKLLRKYARSWGIDANKIGVIGFSAGGHLAATLSTKSKGKSRPDFSILFYPVITFTGTAVHEGSRENLTGSDQKLWELYSAEAQVTHKTPPALLFHSSDDLVVPAANSELYIKALKNKGIGNKFIVYPIGGHGWGFNTDFKYHGDMTKNVLDYIMNFKP